MSMQTTPRAADRPGREDDDEREALFNGGERGPARRIQVPGLAITRVLGILVDFDQKHLLPGNPYFPPADDPEAFLEGIAPALDRHPLARDAEVRASGRGLHLIVRLEPFAELRDAAQQRYWAQVVRAVQFSLPGDPNVPGITALTRPVGAINSKTSAVVRQLREGKPVTPERVIDFVKELAEAPAAVLASLLFGASRVDPCPFCCKPGQPLGVSGWEGRCYGCGRVDLEQLMDLAVRGAPAGAPERPRGQRPNKAVGRVPAAASTT